MIDPERRRRATAVTVVALLLCLATSGPVLGHQVDPDVRFVIEQDLPERAGLTFVIVRGVAPQVVVENRSDELLEVLDDRGRPFLRIGDGRVDADVASLGWLDTADPAGLPPGVEIPRDLPPRWETVRDEPSWGWFDHRLHQDDITFVAPAEQTVVLDRWELPFELGGEPALVTGRTERRPEVGVTLAAWTGSSTPLPGVRAQLLAGALPGILLTAAEPVTVLGADGEPFLRFGSDGVEANERSPTWVLSGRAAEEGTDPSGLALDPAAEPVWIEVASGPSFGWLDPRAVAPDELPAGADPQAGPVTLTSWRVPLVAEDGTEVALTGETRYVLVPDLDTGRDLRLPIAVGVAGVAALGLGLWQRRRRA